MKNVFSFLALLLITSTMPTVVQAMSDISGRPPENALERVEPQVYEVSFQVSYTSSMMTGTYGGRPCGPDTRNPCPRVPSRFLEQPMRMPLIVQNTFSRADRDSISLQMWIDEREDRNLGDRAELRGGLPFGSYELYWTLPEEPRLEQRGRWKLTYDQTVWASRLNEDRARRAAWPRAWPEETRDALRPQRMIESDNPIFRETVERVSEGKLRSVPPYYAVKDLLRYSIQQVQVTGSSERRVTESTIQGVNVQGALKTAQSGRGSEHDLLCVCIAMLRAAEIPARPVIGIEYDPMKRDRFEVRSWGEFFLPGSGWVPFHPVKMRDAGLHRTVQEPWPGLGTIESHNRFVPLAFHFSSPNVDRSFKFPTIWTWIGGSEDEEARFQQIDLSLGWKGEPRPEDH